MRIYEHKRDKTRFFVRAGVAYQYHECGYIEALAYDLDFEQEKEWFDFKIYRKRKPTRYERHAIRDFLISIERGGTEE
ncbi:hypothetical protein EQ830_25985 [Escherichia coli]|uniref:hypothetical protein n=1 Tax=Escherichia coli TaxID=562 RepID=UPI000FFC07AF|nr:hypothetical protein [Escherichia coli]RXA34932.1 hypothetical protein EQ830_25985 [Escherichia coli]